ncbi:hypothetical protein FOA52_010775 [Chlamydomonas sp. UWO 241]|nr:hypothetical protein FOA52_010775 [Chlamydomonas sp. UWO 241]
MMMRADEGGCTALMVAAQNGHVDALRLMLDYPSADAAAVMRQERSDGGTAFMWAAFNGHVDAMRVLLDHPDADPSGMMMRANFGGWIALMGAAQDGHVDAMRLMLDHPSADAAAMVAVVTPSGLSAFVLAAEFAAGQPTSTPLALDRSCVPLLLLRHSAVGPQPSDAQAAHMSKVMQALCQGPRSAKMFEEDRPDDARDACIRMLLERGACALRVGSLVVSRIMRERAPLTAVPQPVNEAAVGAEDARPQKRPRGSA